MIESIVTWRWKPPAGYRSKFGPETVNTLKAMTDRHYPAPHRFICVTDDPVGIDPSVEILPLWNDFAELQSPHGDDNPSCYRRLRMFAPDAGRYFGKRFAALDLDCVVTGDLRPLWDRPGDFWIWGDTNPTTYYNGSMMVLEAGTRAKVWKEFDPVKSPRSALAMGMHGSDQAWISLCLGRHEKKWGIEDGVYSFRNHLRQHRDLPSTARIVLFHGHVDPWTPSVQHYHPWVTEHYR